MKQRTGRRTGNSVGGQGTVHDEGNMEESTGRRSGNSAGYREYETEYGKDGREQYRMKEHGTEYEKEDRAGNSTGCREHGTENRTEDGE